MSFKEKYESKSERPRVRRGLLGRSSRVGSEVNYRRYAIRAYYRALSASAKVDDWLLLYMPLGIIIAVVSALVFVHYTMK
jgi:hypothetical protein